MSMDQHIKKEGVFFFIGFFIRNLLRIFGLNILFVLTSLPIVTLPLSMISMIRVLQKIISDESSSVFKTYLLHFQDEILKKIVLGWTTFILLLGVGAGTYYSFLFSHASLLMMILFILGCTTLIIFVALVAQMMQLLAAVRLSYVDIIRNAMSLFLLQPLKMMLVSIITILIMFFGLLYFPYTLPMFVCFIFSTNSYISTVISYPKITQYVIERT